MNAADRRIGTIIVVLSLFMVSVAHGKNSNLATTTEPNSSKGSGTHEELSKKDSDTKPDASGGLIHGTLNIVLMEERTKTLSEIDKQRKATLAYLTQERSVVMDELEKELNRVTDLFLSERRATMVEMEAIGNRIVENAILKSERLIDHFFIRAIQMALVVILACCIVGFLIFRMVAKKKSDPS